MSPHESVFINVINIINTYCKKYYILKTHEGNHYYRSPVSTELHGILRLMIKYEINNISYMGYSSTETYMDPYLNFTRGKRVQIVL